MTEKKSTGNDTGAPKAEGKTGAAASSRPSNGSTAAKGRIASRIAYYLFPDGDGINLNQDISDNCRTSADAIAVDVNAYGKKYASGQKLGFTPVSVDDVRKLKTVQNLKELIISHLG